MCFNVGSVFTTVLGSNFKIGLLQQSKIKYYQILVFLAYSFTVINPPRSRGSVRKTNPPYYKQRV